MPTDKKFLDKAGAALLYKDLRDRFKGLLLESAADKKFVAQTVTVNDKPLSGNVKLTAADVGALASDGKALTAGTADTALNVAWENTNHPSFHSVATSGNYSELNGLPTFGTAAAKNINEANGVAGLDENGHLPSSVLPGSIDEIIEAENKEAFPGTGTAAKIYVAKDTNKTYRWGGSAYVEISASLAVGTTTGTAYDGKAGADLATALGTKDSTTGADDVTAFGKIRNIENDIAKIDLTKDAAKNVFSATKFTNKQVINVEGGATGSVEFDGTAPATLNLTVNDHNHTSDNITDFAEAVKAVKVDAAAAADKLTTARTISATGDVTGSVSFDGSANVEIALALDPALIVDAQTIIDEYEAALRA